MMPAMHSPEVTQEDQDDRPVLPILPKASLHAVRVREHESGKLGEIHVQLLYGAMIFA
jgi:hypothetical protein